MPCARKPRSPRLFLRLMRLPPRRFIMLFVAHVLAFLSVSASFLSPTCFHDLSLSYREPHTTSRFSTSLRSSVLLSLSFRRAVTYQSGFWLILQFSSALQIFCIFVFKGLASRHIQRHFAFTTRRLPLVTDFVCLSGCSSSFRCFAAFFPFSPCRRAAATLSPPHAQAPAPRRLMPRQPSLLAGKQ